MSKRGIRFGIGVFVAGMLVGVLGRDLAVKYECEHFGSTTVIRHNLAIACGPAQLVK